MEKKEDKIEELEGKKIEVKYDSAKIANAMNQIPEEVREEMEKTKEKLEKFKKDVLKKFDFVMGIGIIAPEFSAKFEEEELLEEERVLIDKDKEKPIHVFVVIPEEQFKDVRKIKAEIVKIAKEIKPKIWIHVKSPVDVWNYCLDAKFELASGVAMSFPLYDKGILAALRVCEIHKNLCLRKFERYVTSYVIAGSLVAGNAMKTSDVDVYLIIDDTDVKRMSRVELKERLRGIIYTYIAEASELAGVKNNLLNVQVYTLTDFWESVKDAHPVIFTFLRDGIPLYDRGTFLPWKSLLKQGRIKPSPEAIDMFMSSGDKLKDTVKNRLLDIAIIDLYWGVLTPSQALLMLYGLPPPKPKETAPLMKEVFVDKEKILEQKYVDILDRIVKVYKDYEHEKVKEVKGAEIDKMNKDAEDFMKRLKELRESIEKRTQEKTIEQVYSDIFAMLEGIFGKKANEKLISDFENNLVKKGKMPLNYVKILKDIVKAREDFKKGKLDKHEVENARKNAALIINHLIEYNQRCDLVAFEKGRIQILYDNGKETADLVLTEPAFIAKKDGLFKITDKIEKSNKDEFEKALQNQKGKMQARGKSKIFEILRKELGDFEVVL
jgi:uncharacterized protein (UPF0332 family)/predicted nucleotidyltransferase